MFGSYRRLENDRRALHQAHRLLRFEVGCRFAITVQLAFTVALGWCVPESITAKMFAVGGWAAHGVLISMTAVLSLLLADIAVNDLLPARFKLQKIKNRRLLLFSMVTAVYVVCTMATLHFDWDGGTVLIAGYLATAGVSAHYAITLALWELYAHQ